jgi:PPM family protein phosphatase
VTAFRAGSATHAGRVRSLNEDSLLVGVELFAVADGMGGHQGGEVASGLAVEALGETVNAASLSSLKEGVRVANRAIFERAGSDPGLHGMGTTLCAIRLIDTPEGQFVGWVNVGDSRIYLFRDGALTQLSVDHSLVEDLVRDGQLTPEEAAVHPQRNIVTRALGVDLDVDVDGDLVIPRKADRFLLCSDGLFNEVDENRIAGALRRLSDPDEAAAELVRLANEHGGRDNITVVLVEVVDDGGAAEAASAALAGAAGTVDSHAEPTTAPANPSVADDPQVLPGARSSLPEVDADDLRHDGDDLYEDLEGAQTRRVTWRVVAFVVVLVLVLTAIVGAIGWYARQTYYVAFADDEVAIYKGRPGGFLWFEPTVEQRMGIDRGDVPASRIEDLEDGKDQPSLGDARAYVTRLRDQIDSTTTTQPRTTTTRPRTTTTTAPRAATTRATPSTSPTTANPP